MHIKSSNILDFHSEANFQVGFLLQFTEREKDLNKFSENTYYLKMYQSLRTED